MSEPRFVKPNQQMKRVYGLRGTSEYCPTLVEFGPLDIMAMDAPDVLPAGSMVFDARDNNPRTYERITYRDRVPTFRQGDELWIDGVMCLRARESRHD